MSATHSQPPAAGEAVQTPTDPRADYRSPNGIASWWQKDGLWHVALPCPEVVDGLRPGGFRWTEHEFQTRDEAVEAIALLGEPSDSECQKAVSGLAAMAEHDAKVSDKKGLHGLQLIRVQRHARAIRKASRVCNSHAALVGALEEAAALFGQEATANKRVIQWRKKTSAALQSAKGAQS